VAQTPDAATIRSVLAEVSEFARDNDARIVDRAQRMLAVAPEVGQFLSILVRSTGARRILEIGTSSGYSTLWLAWAATATGGHVETVERDPAKIDRAEHNLQRAGLRTFVTLHHQVALDALQARTEPYDLIFLDADRASYVTYLPHLVRLLRPGAVLVTDNVISHAPQVADFLQLLRTHANLDTVTVPVGSGEELTYRRD